MVEKAALVAESLAPGAVTSAIACVMGPLQSAPRLAPGVSRGGAR